MLCLCRRDVVTVSVVGRVGGPMRRREREREQCGLNVRGGDSLTERDNTRSNCTTVHHRHILYFPQVENIQKDFENKDKENFCT